jgi:N-acetylmuramoyl-L-alanine amidase
MDAREVKIKLAERYVVALTLWGEARSEFTDWRKLPDGRLVGKWRTAPIESRVAVGSVIANRVKAPKRFGENFKDVCLKPYAFSCWQPKGGPENFDAMMLRAEAFIEHGDASPYLSADRVLRECLVIADALIRGSLLDRAAGATHYYAEWIDPPVWTRPPAVLVASVCGHRLYKDVR